MILTTLTAVALSAYAAKTFLGLRRESEVKKLASAVKSAVIDAVQAARKGVTDSESKAGPKASVEDLARENDLLISRVFSRATDAERQSLVSIFEKYADDRT